MARLIPPQLPLEAPFSEQRVHVALSALPDSWTVLWNTPIGLFGRPKPGLRQIDFLIIHARQGLIVLEVKGGEISIQEGVWHTKPRGRDPVALSRSPFEQAADQRFQLSRFLGEKLDISSGAFSHAVALPDCTIDQALGPDAPPELVFDERDLEHPGDALRRVTKHWETRADLTTETIDSIVALLKPTLDATVVLAVRSATTEQEIERETRRQVEFVEGQVEVWAELLRSHRAVVMGGAGTGKTVLAAERARRLCEAGQKTLLLCHRAAVFAFISTLLQAPADEHAYDPRRQNRLHIAHWQGLLRGLAVARRMAEPSSHVPNVDEWFFAAADELDVRYDAVVIDEGQEFVPAQFEALRWLLADPDEGAMYVFADPYQFSGFHLSDRPEERVAARGKYRWAPPIEGSLLQLVVNCRNSQPIAALAESFYPLEAATASVEGPTPEFFVVQERDELISSVLDHVEELRSRHGFRPNQILLVPVGLATREIERAARKRRLGVAIGSDLFRFPLTSIDVRVVIGTPDEVQGLEAEVVAIAYWQDGPIQASDVRDMYVATTRARSILSVFTNMHPGTIEADARNALSAGSEISE